MSGDTSLRCSQCLVGEMVPTKAFYCQWSNGHFITAPDFPAWVCDVCGAREYEPQAVLELQTLVEMSRPALSRPSRLSSPGKDDTTDLGPAPHRRHP